ncbi:hypothetical protein JQ615_25630 [Bradyrhizobium jicamae]|uniref:Uncharacterized protein n=1 Tax=Bradyrhizobium jicamae TaxID=280332 RepID=A0ABS5FPR7_9BRAD|nr:hypothetical protein [Bradyrhizobium jicamae]MBR0798773.1 hypothetical protein [Bradyrhizobium jicamae]
MQTLALQLTTTFVDDALEFVKGFGRVVIHLATAPIERIARACDVAGVLEQRRADKRAARRHNRFLSPFAGLSDLT